MEAGKLEATLRNNLVTWFKTHPRSHEKNTELITESDVWTWALLTHFGEHKPHRESDMGRLIFNSHPYKDNPWASHLSTLRPNKTSPRVLITGSVEDLCAMGTEGMILSHQLIEICDWHHLQNIRIESVREIIDFWDRFYGTPDFLTKSTDIPAVIVMNGAMRNHPAEGGESLDMSELLIEIAHAYMIPAEGISL